MIKMLIFAIFAIFAVWFLDHSQYEAQKEYCEIDRYAYLKRFFKDRDSVKARCILQDHLID